MVAVVAAVAAAAAVVVVAVVVVASEVAVAVVASVADAVASVAGVVALGVAAAASVAGGSKLQGGDSRPSTAVAGLCFRRESYLRDACALHHKYRCQGATPCVVGVESPKVTLISCPSCPFRNPLRPLAKLLVDVLS